MKKKLFAYTLLMLPALLMTSCLKDQDDKFSESASERVSNYLTQAKEVLTSSENGWVLNYYPDASQSYGGYAYILKFDDQNVTASSEIAEDVTETITTTYILDNEDGPSISFDTYNDFLHYFATPHGSSGAGGYQAYGGDFIFIILNISEDKNTITLKGNRSGNIIYMHRLMDTDGETYLSEVLQVEENMPTSYTIPDGTKVIEVPDEEAEPDEEGNLPTKEVEVAKFITVTLSSGHAYFEGEDTDITVAYHYTPNGVEFYKPVTVQGHEISGIKHIAEADKVPAIGDESLMLTVVYLPANEMFVNAEAYVAISNVSEAAQPYFLACKTVSDGEGENIGQMVFVNVGAPYGYGIFFTSGNYNGLMGLDTEFIDDNKIKFTYNSSRNYSDGGWYYNHGYSGLVDYLASTTFTLTTDSKVKPSYFILTDDEDATKYFKLVVDPVSNPFAN